jgi:hypothetical protein
MINFFEENKKNNLNEIYELFLNEYNNDLTLINHRTYIENNNLGYGEKPFHVIWRELVQYQPSNFKFLEIGVYKGQVLSLIKLLSKLLNKNCELYGVTPLNNTGDKFLNTYDDVNYGETIISLFNYFNLEFDLNTNIINGSSTDEQIKNKIRSLGIFDIVYIDGCHDYDCVVSDIKLMKEITKINSFVIFDDSSCYKDIQISKFKGHIDVCNAIRDLVENDETFEEIICVGHNRVFKRII